MLSSKQKRFLKSKANHLRPIAQVGKNGLNEAFLQDLQQALTNRELVKVNLLQNTDATLADVAAALQDLPQVEVVQKVGRVLTIYRPNDQEKYQRLSAEVKTIR